MMNHQANSRDSHTIHFTSCTSLPEITTTLGLTRTVRGLRILLTSHLGLSLGTWRLKSLRRSIQILRPRPSQASASPEYAKIFGARQMRVDTKTFTGLPFIAST